MIPPPCRSVLYSATPEDARKTATITNHMIIRNCQTKGTIGKNKVDIMCPTANDPSSINSIAMLIRFLRNITMIKMIRSRMAPSMRKTIQVTKMRNKNCNNDGSRNSHTKDYALAKIIV